MKTFIICFLFLTLASCKKTQNLNSSASSHLKIFEAKSFFTFTHLDHESILRQKLLNKIVTKQFPSKSTKESINSGDEFLFTDNQLSLSQRDLELYHDREKTHTKVIVSDSNQLEVFFIPAGITLVEGIQALKLNPKAEKFKYFGMESENTIRGATIHLVYFDLDELVTNDQFFYQSVVSDASAFSNRKWEILEGQALEIRLSAKFYSEGTTLQQFDGRTRKCTKDLMEAGGCFCTFKRLVSDKNLKLEPISNFSNLGVDFKVDGGVFDYVNSTDAFMKNEKGEYVLNLNLKKNFSFELNYKNFNQVYFQSNAQGYDGHCFDNPPVSEILRTETKLEGQFIIKGRGKNFLSQIKI